MIGVFQYEARRATPSSANAHAGPMKAITSYLKCKSADDSETHYSKLNSVLLSHTHITSAHVALAKETVNRLSCRLVAVTYQPSQVNVGTSKCNSWRGGWRERGKDGWCDEKSFKLKSIIQQINIRPRRKGGKFHEIKRRHANRLNCSEKYAVDLNFWEKNIFTRDSMLTSALPCADKFYDDAEIPC